MTNVLAPLYVQADWVLLAMRLVLAASFFAHGKAKWSSWKASGPVKPMDGAMRLLSICEPLGALAMVGGLLTQWAALGFALVMLGAINFKARVWKKPFVNMGGDGWEFDLALLGLSLAILVFGAGAFSLDRLLLGW